MFEKFKITFFAIVFALTCISCNHVSTSRLEKEVKALFNKNAASEGVDAKATKVTLIKKDANNYVGSITIQAEGETEDYDIKVISDGRSFQYEIIDE